MKVGIAQFSSKTGDLKANLFRHLEILDFAGNLGIDFLLFPELSLIGYEPSLAEKLAMRASDPLLNPFQHFSDTNQISMGIGLPLLSPQGILISTLVFQPKQVREIYSKTFLHNDEKPFFIPGTNSPLIKVLGVRIGLAICYEISVEQHAKIAFEENIQVYMASVAKNSSGIIKAHARMKELSKEYGWHGMLCNAVGPMDDGPGAGGSAVWDQGGKLLVSLDHFQEGLIIWDPLGGNQPLRLNFPSKK